MFGVMCGRAEEDMSIRDEMMAPSSSLEVSPWAYKELSPESFEIIKTSITIHFRNHHQQLFASLDSCPTRVKPIVTIHLARCPHFITHFEGDLRYTGTDQKPGPHGAMHEHFRMSRSIVDTWTRSPRRICSSYFTRIGRSIGVGI